MAASKKYADLPDVTIDAPEIYETPELTDGASTAPTGTVRTDSEGPSENEDADGEGDDSGTRRRNGDGRLDHQRIDRDTARRRFEPSLVSAKDVNFGDTVAADERRSYRTRRRRRRRGERDEDDSGDGSDEETLSARIARLRREVEEVKLEVESGREEKAQLDNDQSVGGVMSDAEKLDQLGRLVNGLRAPSGGIVGGSTEEALLKSLTNGTTSKESALAQAQPPEQSNAHSYPSPDAAIAAFADRLTSLESALGLSTVDSTTQPTSILPALASLSTQLSTLTTTLIPSKTPSSNSTPSIPNLDALQSRIHALTIESDRLTASRKAALISLTDLHEARIRHTTTRKTTSNSRPTSSHQTGPLQNIEKQESDIHSGLFLDEQASKITALYHVLPTIQGMQPLLPTVLERLRSLSVIHAGAAEARGELDEVVKRQGEMRGDVRKWREAVESVEKKMVEMGTEMKENVEVVGGLVRGVEERVKGLRMS